MCFTLSFETSLCKTLTKIQLKGLFHNYNRRLKFQVNPTIVISRVSLSVHNRYSDRQTEQLKYRFLNSGDLLPRNCFSTEISIRRNLEILNFDRMQSFPYLGVNMIKIMPCKFEEHRMIALPSNRDMISNKLIKFFISLQSKMLCY